MPKTRFNVLSGGLSGNTGRAFGGEDGDVDWNAVRIGFRESDPRAIELVSQLVLGQLRYLRAPEFDIEDLQMETLWALYARRDIGIDGSYSAYVRRAARNKFYDWCRRNRRGKSPSFEPLDDAVDVEAPDLLEAASEAAVRRCIDQLTTEHRRIIENKYLVGRSNREIADALGISESSVRRQLSDARAVLRELMLD